MSRLLSEPRQEIVAAPADASPVRWRALISLGYVLVAGALLGGALLAVPYLNTRSASHPSRYPALGASVPLPGRPISLAVGERAVWVACGSGWAGETRPGQAGLIVRLDPVATTFGVGSVPVHLASGREALWVVNAGRDSVSRLDPATNEVVATVTVGPDASRLAVGDDGVWVAHRTRRITRIDPLTNEVVARLDFGPASNWTDLAIGEGAVWLLDGRVVDPSTAASVARLDPTVNQIVETIQVGHVAQGVALGEGSLWVVNAEPKSLSGSVSRIDPRTNEVVATIPVGKAPSAIAIGGGLVWVASPADQTISWIDPQTNRVDFIPVGRAPSALAFGQDALWFTSADDRSVTRVQP